MATKTESRPCFDALSQYCPCILAVLGECVACSILRGEDKCNCGWSGVCVYDQFIRAGKLPKDPRPSFDAPIINLSEIEGSREKAYVLTLEAPTEVALWSFFPGTFILLRPNGTSERFNVPLSVMDVKGTSLEIAFEVVGPKTKALAQSAIEKGCLTATGPFWSGLQGQRALKDLSSEKVLAVAKGMGQAGITQVAKYILRKGGYIKVLLGPGSLGKVFVQDKLEAMGAAVEVLPKEEDHNLSRVIREITDGGYSLVVSANADFQHQSLAQALNRIALENQNALLERRKSPQVENPAPPVKETRGVPLMIWLSNLTMVCADGICGACLKNGFRGCKASISMDSFFSS